MNPEAFQATSALFVTNPVAFVQVNINELFTPRLESQILFGKYSRPRHLNRWSLTSGLAYAVHNSGQGWASDQVLSPAIAMQMSHKCRLEWPLRDGAYRAVPD